MGLGWEVVGFWVGVGETVGAGGEEKRVGVIPGGVFCRVGVPVGAGEGSEALVAASLRAQAAAPRHKISAKTNAKTDFNFPGCFLWAGLVGWLVNRYPHFLPS